MIYKKKPISDDKSAAFNAALRLLTRREYSVKELLTKLYVRYSKDAAHDALKRCQELNYQSDERYADMIVRHYAQSHYGPIKIYFVASQKGVGKNIIEPFMCDINWQNSAIDALKKKYGKNKLVYDERLKALSFLQRRGFLKDQCVSALNEYINLCE